jgi:outer membrane murein-binding lipoprotein Lpp
MGSRALFVLLICFSCVVLSGSTFSQDIKRRPPAVNAEDEGSDTSKSATGRLAKSGTLERRVQDLERQVHSLTRDLEALRKEVKPITKDGARPKPL